MRTRSKLLLAGLTTALVFGAFVSAASANRFALSGQQWRAAFTELRFIGFATVTCHVTIEGSFHSRTLSKVLEQLIGYVSKVTVDEGHCTGGSARALTATLPWHVRYNGFSGTLPEITEIHLRMVEAAFEVSAAGVFCLFKSTASSPMRGWVRLVEGGRAGVRVAETLRSDETAQIPLSSGSAFLCGSSGRLAGRSTGLTEGNTTTRITITLVQ